MHTRSLLCVCMCLCINTYSRRSVHTYAYCVSLVFVYLHVFVCHTCVHVYMCVLLYVWQTHWEERVFMGNQPCETAGTRDSIWVQDHPYCTHIVAVYMEDALFIHVHTHICDVHILICTCARHTEPLNTSTQTNSTETYY
jgi:hypothetical protein